MNVRAIVINPWDRSVSEITLAEGLEQLTAALSGPIAPDDDGRERQHRCELVDRVSLGQSPIGGEPVDLWVDDEGMFAEPQAYFKMGDQTFAGRGLIMGTSPSGFRRPTTLTIPMVLEKLEWVPLGTRYDPPRPVVMSFETMDELLAAMGSGQ